MIKKIFYIEKEKILRKMFELALVDDPEAEVYTTEEAADCLYQVKEMAADVLLIDIGTIAPLRETFLKELSENKYCQSIPIIALGFEKDLERIQREKWYSGTLKKPISVLKLLQTIRESVIK